MRMGDFTETKIIHLLLEHGKLKLSQTPDSILEKLRAVQDECRGSKNTVLGVCERTIRNRLKEMCAEGLIQRDARGYYAIKTDYFISGKTLQKGEWKEILNHLLENQVLDAYRFLRNHLGNEKNEILDNLELERYRERIAEPVYRLSDHRDVIRKINYALAQNLWMRVNYKGKSYTLCPVRYVVSRDGGRKYLCGIRKKQLISMELGEIEVLEYPGRADVDKTEYVRQIQNAWDIDVQAPCKIRILVRKDRTKSREVLEQIRAYLGPPVESNGQYVIFDGEIAGLNDFQTWLRGYPEVCFVQKPQRLRQEFVQALLEKNERYGGLA